MEGSWVWALTAATAMVVGGGGVAGSGAWQWTGQGGSGFSQREGGAAVTVWRNPRAWWLGPAGAPAAAPAAGSLHPDSWFSSPPVPAPWPQAPSGAAAAGGSSAGAAGTSSAPSLPAGWPSPADARTSAMLALAQKAVADVNAFRARHGLPPLTVNPTLTLVAQVRAVQMRDQGTWMTANPHDLPLLDYPLATEQALGYAAPGMGAENMVAAADETRGMLMLENSPEHRANLLNPGFTQIGIGVVPLVGSVRGILMVQDFSGTP